MVIQNSSSHLQQNSLIVSDRDGMPSHLGGFTPLVTDPFAVLFFLLLTHHHHLMALLLCMLKKNTKHPFTQHPLSSVPSLISSKGDAYLTKRPTLPSAN